MYSNWKKKTSAFLLALAMMVSFVPAALAVEEGEETHEHEYSTEWVKGASSHWHECSCGDKADVEEHDFEVKASLSSDPTCYQSGKTVEVCSECGYQREITSAPTGDHNYDEGRWSTDNDNHWHACTTNGCTATSDLAKHTPADDGVTTEPTCTADGKITYTCDVCGKTYTRTSAKALGHTYVDGKCVRCKAAEPIVNTTKNFSLTVNKSSSTTVGKSIRSSIGSFSTITFSSVSSSTYGVLYADSSKTKLSTTKDYTYSEASSLYFVAPSKATSYTINYVATLADKSTISGKITIKVQDTSSKTITYKVNAGSSVAFDTDDFEDLYDDQLDGTIRYVKLYTDDSISTSAGTVYYNHNGSGEKAFTKSNLDDYKFYYSRSSYGDYDLSKLSFVVPKGVSDKTITLDCEVYDSDDDYAEGTIKIVISGDSDEGSTIKYSVKPGSSVDFDRDDFNKAYQEQYSGSIRYITLETTDTISTSAGTVYYDYDGSKEKSFTKSTLDDFDFYYSSDAYGDYPINDLSFVVPKGVADKTVKLTYTAYYSSTKYVTGTVEITVGSGGTSASGSTIKYSVKPGSSVDFDRDDFNKAYQSKYSETIRYITLETSDTISTSAGTVYYDYDGSKEKALTKSTLDDFDYYYSSSSYGDYPINDLSFVVPKGVADKTVKLTYTAYYSSTKYVTGTVEITVGSGTASSASTIKYSVKPGSSVDFNRDDFNKAYQTKYSETIRYITLETSDTISTSAGTIYYDYDGSKEKSFTKSTLDDFDYYYSSSSYGDYPINDLSFVVPKGVANKTVKLTYTAYYSSTKYVTGTVEITVGENAASGMSGSVFYYTTPGTNVQINANDLNRFVKKTYPKETLTSVTLAGIPISGSLYYNYYGTSSYGTTAKILLTLANVNKQSFYFSPTSKAQYALTELTYVPAVSGNTCISIPFAAATSGNHSVAGSIFISISKSAVAEIYGVTPKNTAVNLPGTSMKNSIVNASGATPTSIQLLKLPAAAVGTVYLGTGTSTPANITTLYTIDQVNTLRFVPATGYTGSVEIPYVGFTGSNPIASGKFSMGVLTNLKKFSDVTSSTWCYKYVTELSDANVISGYTDNTFKPNNSITYGAALKLIMLAAGYPEQAPTSSTANVFSGYLAKARAEGIITRSNVDLTKTITRQQVAQIAAGAMKLDTTNLTSVQPFIDTTDPSIRALNAAGIVEGYFENGVSSFKPNNTLTRGQVSAIVWRIRNYGK